MPEYDWLLSDDFKGRVTTQVSQSAGVAGMKRYENAIVDRIMVSIREKKLIVEGRELVKAAAQRRTVNDALASVDSVVKLACEIARADKRETVTEADFHTAFQRNYCNFWPLCEGR